MMRAPRRSAFSTYTALSRSGSGMPQFMGPVAGLDGGTDGSGNPTLDAGGRPLTDEIFILYGDPSFPSLSVSNEPIASRTSTIQDRKSTRLNSSQRQYLVCRL